MSFNVKRAGLFYTLAATLGLASGAIAQDSKTTQAPPVPGGKATSLAPNFKAGQEMKFTQHIVRSDTMSLASMGDQTTWMDQTNAWTGKVLSADDKGAVLELQFKGIKAEMKQTTKQGEKEPEVTSTKWDSAAAEDDKDQGNQLVAAFRPVIGARFKLTLDPKGVVTNVESLDAVSPSQTRLAAFINQIVSPEAIKARWQPMLAIKTDGAGAFPGQDWTAEQVLLAAPIGQEKQTTRRTLSKMDGDMAKISIKGEVAMESLKPGEKAQAEVSNSAITGSAEWDTKAGQNKRLEWSQKADMNVNAQGFSVKRSYDWTMTITRD